MTPWEAIPAVLREYINKYRKSYMNSCEGSDSTKTENLDFYVRRRVVGYGFQ